jgi:PAS domain S-box-containing protein/putative nucleotidyltransferase with HDIG domain
MNGAGMKPGNEDGDELEARRAAPAVMDERRREARVAELERELERGRERERDAAEMRKAMLFLLEDVNETASRVEKARAEWVATFDSISDLIFVHDARMRIIRCNRAYQRASGMGFKEIVGRPYYEVFPMTGAPSSKCLSRVERFAGGDSVAEPHAADEEEITLPDSGPTFKVRVYEAGAPEERLFIHVMEDVTEEKASEERVRESEERYRHLFDRMNDAAFLIEAGTGLVLDANRQGEALLGRSRAEILGMRREALHPPEAAEECARRFEEHSRAARTSGFDGTVRRKDGSNAAVNVTVSIIEHGGKSLYLALMRDITERKKAEERLEEEMGLTRQLLMVSYATAHTTDIDKLMGEVVGCLHGITGCDAVLSYLHDARAGVLRPAHSVGLKPGLAPYFRAEPLGADLAFVRSAYGERRSVIVGASGPAWREGGASSRGSRLPLGWAAGLGRMVAIPLMAKDEPLGFILCLYAGRGKGEALVLTEKEKEVMDGISYQVSIALEEARLYKDSVDKAMDLARKVETIQTMHEIDRSILSSLKPGEILEIAASMVARLIYCERAGIHLVDRERGCFALSAGFGVEDAAKGSLIPFGDTMAAEAVRTLTPGYAANLGDDASARPAEKALRDEGFLSVIMVPLVVKGEAVAILSLAARRPAAFTSEDLATIEKLTSQIGVALENSRLITDIEDLFLGTVKTLAEAIDAKSPWTRGHSERVTDLAIGIGEAMGLSGDEVKTLRLAGLLHDIGKIGTYEAILDKPGRLTPEELAVMRQHPAKGADILNPIKQMGEVLPAIRHHHEFYDGTGYPDGVKGPGIPLMARILAVADTVDAMGADRPYRKGKAMDEIAAELRRCSGAQFDPEVVEAFLRTPAASGL